MRGHPRYARNGAQAMDNKITLPTACTLLPTATAPQCTRLSLKPVLREKEGAEACRMDRLRPPAKKQGYATMFGLSTTPTVSRSSAALCTFRSITTAQYTLIPIQRR